MKRGLHTKLMLIMLLLNISLMTVVGAFLIRGVSRFYQDQFYTKMQSVFQDDLAFAGDLYAAASQDDGKKLDVIMTSKSSSLGINSDTRNYYILDGDGNYLFGSSTSANIEITPNILSTITTGEASYQSNSTAKYMDVALPVSSEGNKYIIYIRDDKQNVQDLNTELFLIIMEALIISLVISVLLSFLLSKTLVTPVERLTVAAEMVSRGEFTEKITVQTRDEIGILNRTFNNMASQLRNTMNDIEKERNKLITVFSHMTDGVVAFSGDGKVTHHNPAAERMLGCPLGGSSVNFATLFGHFASINDLLCLNYPEYAEFERNINGMDLEIALAPFSGYDERGGIIAVIHDVTQQKKSEQLRREFVANVSHELRTPITNIRSYAETLSDSSEVPPEMEKSFLKVIVNESDRMAKIVQDLLNLSRMDAEANFNFEMFSFAASVGNTYDSMLLEAKKRSLDLSLSFEDKIPEILGDRARIEQVLINILSNAVRYTPEGGSISVKAGHDASTVWMAVQDTGIGIPEADLPRIFDRFYRVDKARSRDSGGTGLGLSIAMEIIKKHNGSINVESTLGKGTTMTVILPIDAKLS